jgi:uncharacterized protein YgbK (DUF1537 family)
MQESDLARHLQQQAALDIGNIPLTWLDDAPTELAERIASMASSHQGVVFDGLTEAHLTATGACLQQMASGRDAPLFIVGSSGVEYALTQFWNQQGLTPEVDRYERFEPVEQVLVVSGSASKLSETQIRTAVDAGFREVAIDVEALTIGPETGAAERQLARDVVAALADGASVVMHTARGPDDPRVARLIQALHARGCSPEQARHQSGRMVAEQLGTVVNEIVRSHPLRRLVLSGGDTSSRITQVLAPDALEIRARLAPGAPLCTVLSSAPHLRGLELALKGGQMGGADYFVRALRGNAPMA